MTTTDISLPGQAFAKCPAACPMCGREQFHFRLNPRLYWHTEQDLDGRPSHYQCLQMAAGIHPPLYELWHCDGCHFTAHNRTFPDPLKHVYIDQSVVRKALKEAIAGGSRVGRVGAALGGDIAVARAGVDQAVRLALLTICFRTFLIDLLRQGNAALGRDYLRLAWLFRDAAERDDIGTMDGPRLEAVGSYWPDLPGDEHAALEAASAAFNRALQESSVEGDAWESMSILLQIGRIALQAGDRPRARETLRQCLQDALTEQQRIQGVMRGPETGTDRAELVTASRRLGSRIDECRDLLDMTAGGTSPPGTGGEKPAPARKGGWRGLLGR